jgi:hypothetical protein
MTNLFENKQVKKSCLSNLRTSYEEKLETLIIKNN